VKVKAKADTMCLWSNNAAVLAFRQIRRSLKAVEYRQLYGRLLDTIGCGQGFGFGPNLFYCGFSMRGCGLVLDIGLFTEVQAGNEISPRDLATQAGLEDGRAMMHHSHPLVSSFAMHFLPH